MKKLSSKTLLLALSMLLLMVFLGGYNHFDKATAQSTDPLPAWNIGRRNRRSTIGISGLWSVPAIAQPIGDNSGSPTASISEKQLPPSDAKFVPQVTGELGSASATTTISGKQLPSPDPKFGGAIEQRASVTTQVGK